MPRRRRLPPLDYSHLRDRPMPFILDEAIERPDARLHADPERRLSLDNLNLIKLFGDRATLRYGEVLDAFDAAGLWSTSPKSGDRWSTNYAAERAGRLIGIGLRERVLAEDRTEEGERCWTLLCRRSLYQTIRGVRYRVELTTPEEAEALALARARAAKLEAIQEKRRATIARKHAEAIRPEILAALVELGRCHELIPMIPREWAEFVPADIYERWPRIVDATGLLVDLHMGWDRRRQWGWLCVLNSWAGIYREAMRQVAEREAALADVPEEDLDALAAL